MIHKSLSYNFNAHYGVSISSASSSILVQLQDEYGTQSRVRMTKEEALEFIEEIKSFITAIKD